MRPDSPEYEAELKKRASNHLAVRDLEQLYESFRKVVETPQGRHVFASILQMFPYDQNIYSANNSQFSYNYGAIAPSLWIRNELFRKAKCNNLFAKMVEEADQRNQALELEREKLVDEFKRGR